MRSEKAWGDGSASGVPGDGLTQGCAWEPEGTRGAHVEHAVHGRDAGRVEAQRLVERRRFLPSRKEGIRCGPRCGPGAGGRCGGGGACSVQGGGLNWSGWGAGHAAEHTWNMLRMFLALDVSKLSGWLNADASCQVERRAYDAGQSAGWEAGGRCGGGGASSVQEQGSTRGVGAQGSRRSARGTCCACL